TGECRGCRTTAACCAGGWVRDRMWRSCAQVCQSVMTRGLRQGHLKGGTVAVLYGALPGQVEEQTDCAADAHGESDEQIPAGQRSEEDDADEQEHNRAEGGGP